MNILTSLIDMNPLSNFGRLKKSFSGVLIVMAYSIHNPNTSIPNIFIRTFIFLKFLLTVFFI